MSILLNTGSRILVQGATGQQGRRHLPFMVDYGTNVVAGTSPGHAGQSIRGVPVFDTVKQAAEAVGPFDLSVVFVAATHAAEAAMEAAAAGVPTTVVLAEGVPFRDSMRMIAFTQKHGTRLIGPNCQGIISPGKGKVGASGGHKPSRMFTAGRVGVVSRSGGMGAETCWSLTRAGIGQSTYLAVGGELINGTSLSEIALLFENDPETDAIVTFGEPGTDQEERLAECVADGRISKPVVAYVAGSFVESQGTGRSYGHAGAVIGKATGSPSSKRAVMREAGIHIAERWVEIPALVARLLPGAMPIKLPKQREIGRNK